MLKDIKEITKELPNVEITKEEDLDIIEKKLIEYGIDKYRIDCDMAFDSPGWDVFYYVVAYICNEELYMFTGTFAN